MNFIFPLILGMSSSQLTNSYFSEGWPNHQPDYVIFGLCTLLYTYFYFFGCCYKYNLTWILYQCDSKSATQGLVMSWESPIGFDDFPWSSPGGILRPRSMTPEAIWAQVWPLVVTCWKSFWDWLGHTLSAPRETPANSWLNEVHTSRFYRESYNPLWNHLKSLSIVQQVST